MVTRTEEPGVYVTGHAAAEMAICPSVSDGLSDEATERAIARAWPGSFCRAIVRTLSRAAAESVLCAWNARPNSAMPRTSRIRSGTTRANSTALAPRWSRSRCRIVVLLSARSRSSSLGASARVRMHSGAATLRGEGRCAGRCGSAGGGRRRGTAGQLAGDAVEQVAEVSAEQGHGGDDHDGDGADHEAVLDGGGALLLPLEAVLGEGGEGDEGGVGLEHVCSWGCPPTGTGRG